MAARRAAKTLAPVGARKFWDIGCSSTLLGEHLEQFTMVNCSFFPACGAVSHQIRLFIIANGKDGGQNTDPAFCE